MGVPVTQQGVPEVHRNRRLLRGYTADSPAGCPQERDLGQPVRPGYLSGRRRWRMRRRSTTQTERLSVSSGMAFSTRARSSTISSAV